MKKAHRRSFREYYDTTGFSYDWWYGPALTWARRKALRFCPPEAGQRTLEVGVGTGLSFSFFEQNADITGIDLSDILLQQAAERAGDLGMPNVTLKNMNAEHLEFPDNHFDRVYSFSVFSVMSHPEVALEEVIRVTKPSGLIVISAHFKGESGSEKALDRVLNPLTMNLLGYRTTTPREFLENNPKVSLVQKERIGPFNFSTVYILRKK